jgi:predicted nucleic-acid-binding protein
MLAIDTNVVIRFLTRDHPVQAHRALRILSDNDVFVAVTVILESEWVLRDAYGMPRVDVIRELERFCGLERVTVGAADAVRQALALAASGMDFAAALHVAQAGHCEAFATFDRQLAKRARPLPNVAVRLA